MSIKKTLASLALVAGAAMAPMTKAETKPSESQTPVAVQKGQDSKLSRKQVFESAVRAGLPKEEIAKYVDFPEFIPVDKDGRLDKKQVQEMLHPFVTNHLDAIKAFYKDLSSVQGDADFEKASATFLSKIMDSKESPAQLMKKMTELKNDDRKQMSENAKDMEDLPTSATGIVFSSITVITALLALIPKGNRLPAAVLLTLGCAGLLGNSAILAYAHRENAKRNFVSPERAVSFLQKGAEQVHDSYLDGVIQTEKDRQKTASYDQFRQQAQKWMGSQQR